MLLMLLSGRADKAMSGLHAAGGGSEPGPRNWCATGRPGRARRGHGRLPWALLAVLAGGGLACEQPRWREDLGAWPFVSVRRVAVAPVLNFSGEASFDPVRAADLLASELAQVGGVTVTPVNRVVAAMSRSGSVYVRSPQQAADLCRAVGADAILVPAVTEFRPYPPMVMGLVLELYMLPDARPDDPNGSAPAAQMQAIFDASQRGVTARAESFGKHRASDNGPFGWRRYLVTQDGYMRFCFSQGLRFLFDEDSDRMWLAEATEWKEDDQ